MSVLISNEEYAHHVEDAKRQLKMKLEREGYSVRLGYVTQDGHTVDVIGEKVNKVAGFYVVITKGPIDRGRDKADGRESFHEEMEGPKRKVSFRPHVHIHTSTHVPYQAKRAAETPSE
jgi:hypothetical protein